MRKTFIGTMTDLNDQVVQVQMELDNAQSVLCKVLAENKELRLQLETSRGFESMKSNSAIFTFYTGFKNNAVFLWLLHLC